MLARIPRGRRLAPKEFEPRHRGVVVLAVLQGIALVALGRSRGFDVGHAALDGLLPAALALATLVRGAPQRARSIVVCLVLIVESALLVHISGGYIEAHFHFFAMLAVIAIYQDYVPLLLAVGFVVVDHGVLGTIAPTSIYNHPAAIANPWGWALLHAAFVLAEGAALLVVWKTIEDAEDRRSRAQAQLELAKQIADQRETLHRNDRLAALGTLVAGVAHEINNPLTYLSANIELALNEARDSGNAREIERLLGTALGGADRIARITSSLKTVARSSTPGARRAIELDKVVEGVGTFVGSNVPEGVEVTFEPSPEPLRVVANAHEIHQVVLNLVQNAIQAVHPRGGRVRIACKREGPSALVDVADDGPGIPEDVRAKLFTPFFTTKAQGTGLGLSIVHSIVSGHGGSVRVESCPQQGARFIVALPLAGPPQG